MSASSNFQPLATIGAQDLINGIEINCAGFIRKKSRRDRIFDQLGPIGTFLSNLTKWKLYYMVISRGCMYIYVSETANNPLEAFTLQQYNSVKRTSDVTGKLKTCFAVIPHEDYERESRTQTKFFAVPSDQDRARWMFHIKSEMTKANGSYSLPTKPKGLPTEDIYGSIEKPIKEPPPRPGAGYTLERNNSNFQPDEEDGSDLDDYDTIQDINVRTLPRQKLGVPPTPAEQEPVSHPIPEPHKTPGTGPLPGYVNTKKERPVLAAKPNLKTVPKGAYFFDAGGRDEAIGALNEKREEGSFLVRRSRNDDSNVLAIYCGGGVKEFKIQTMGSSYTLDKIDKFTSLDSLLMTYKSKTLPNRDMKLGKGVYEV